MFVTMGSEHGDSEETGVLKWNAHRSTRDWLALEVSGRAWLRIAGLLLPGMQFKNDLLSL